jgi:hypothetical protein
MSYKWAYKSTFSKDMYVYKLIYLSFLFFAISNKIGEGRNDTFGAQKEKKKKKKKEDK